MVGYLGRYILLYVCMYVCMYVHDRFGDWCFWKKQYSVVVVVVVI